jgi:hypothetical protein
MEPDCTKDSGVDWDYKDDHGYHVAPPRVFDFWLMYNRSVNYVGVDTVLRRR